MTKAELLTALEKAEEMKEAFREKLAVSNAKLAAIKAIMDS